MSRKIEIRQGESLFIDFNLSSGVMTAEMSSSFTVLNNKNEEVLNGILTKVSDVKFELRIPSTSLNTFLGKYTILVVVEDSNTGYANYILDGQLSVFK